MPKLTEEELSVLAESDRLYKLAFTDYAGPKYLAQPCRLCQWHSNEETFDEAMRVTRVHEYTAHPALKDWDDYGKMHGRFRLRIKALHDHDCPEEYCVCKCGCHVGPYCGIIGGVLCATCQIREGRGDSEHGLPMGTPERMEQL